MTITVTPFMPASVVKRSNATSESLSFGSRQGATRRQWFAPFQELQRRRVPNVDRLIGGVWMFHYTGLRCCLTEAGWCRLLE